MRLNEYQQKAMTTCMDSCENFSYMFLNLVGEVGEFASKVAKQIRKNNMCIGINTENRNKHYYFSHSGNTQEVQTELKYEAGDILWQLAGLCKVMGWELEEIAQMNLDKLQARKAIGTIDGNGDGIERSK